VLATILFLALWLVLGVAVFLLAARGGVGETRAALRSPAPPGRRIRGTVFAVTYVAFGLVLPIVFLGGNHSNANGKVGGMKLTASEKHGRVLFARSCGVCHTLAAASTVGAVGPNLDTLRPPASLVLHTIENGCLQNPPSSTSPQSCLGQGTMPANLVQGRDAQDVADFVARVAGRE